MDRRSFLKHAGLSLGTLLVADRLWSMTDEVKSGRHSQGIIQLPQEVSVTLHNGVVEKLNRGNNEYTTGDIRVGCRDRSGGLQVSLSSPSEAIRYITFTWNIPRSITTLCLGDHWERAYGDLQWLRVNESRILPWYFVEYDGVRCNGFGVKTSPAAFCYWQTSEAQLQLVMDVRSGGEGVVLGGRELEVATIVTHQSREGERPFQAVRDFCRILCDHPVLPHQPVYGINDWYASYGNNSYDLIMETVNIMADLAENTHNRPFCMVDAGWAIQPPDVAHDGCWGDNYYTPNENFKDMGRLAEEIRSKGMRPGIWMRPLCASHTTSASRLMPGRRPHRPILDPSIPENLAYVERCFQAYDDWGYEMIKHDFTTSDILNEWGFEMLAHRSVTADGWRFYDNGRTSAEIISELYRTIRQAAGKKYLIGCNTVSHLSAGVFELQRTGDDTSGKEWARTGKMGVNSVAFRAPQHHTFYAADGDCVGLTDQVPWEMNKQWMQLLAESGTPLFISIQPDAVDREQKEWIRRSFETASREIPLGEPLDWLDSLTPSRWKLNGQDVSFHWEE